MDQKEIIKLIEQIENNARRLFEDAAALREELSGGSDSSFSKSALSRSQKDELVNKRRNRLLGKK